MTDWTLATNTMGAVGHQIRHADRRAGEDGGAGFLTEQRPASFRPSLQAYRAVGGSKLRRRRSSRLCVEIGLSGSRVAKFVKCRWINFKLIRYPLALQMELTNGSTNLGLGFGPFLRACGSPIQALDGHMRVSRQAVNAEYLGDVRALGRDALALQ